MTAKEFSFDRISGNVLPDARVPFDTKVPHVAVLFPRIGPYHFARLKAASARMRVTAVEFSDVDPTYAWDTIAGRDGFHRVTLFSGVAIGSNSGERIWEVVNKTLTELRPTVVAIPGWSFPCSLAALRWCLRQSVPTVIMSESNAWDERRMPWREAIKGWTVRLCRTGLVGGESHTQYLVDLGMSRNRTFYGYDAVDNEYFSSKADETRLNAVKVRNKLGLPEEYFLASARFVGKKNLPWLIRAYAGYREIFKNSEPEIAGRKPWDLVLLGDGPLKSDIMRLISDLKLDGQVHLPGFKQYQELPLYYGLASVFIHASATEQWGLAVNEAMASGLPVLVSNRCGCAGDLVQEGINGFTFDPSNLHELARLMSRMSDPTMDLRGMGRVSREIVSAVGPSAFGEGLSKATTAALEAPPLKASFLDRILLDFLVRRFEIWRALMKMRSGL